MTQAGQAAAGSNKSFNLMIGGAIVLIIGLISFSAITLIGSGQQPAAPFQTPPDIAANGGGPAATLVPTGSLNPTPEQSIASTQPTLSPTATATPAATSSPRPYEVPPVKPGTATSLNWAGYALLDKELRGISGEWTQPAIDCSGDKATHSAFWIGLDGVTSHSVEQLGTAAECQFHYGSLRADYFAWWEMYPTPMRRITMDVHPGDHFTARVDAKSPTTFELSITNVTTGGSFNTTGTREGSWPTSAEWIVEPTLLCRPTCAQTDLANFGGVTFSNVEADKRGGPVALDTAGRKLVRIDLRVTKDRGRLAATSVMNSATEGFYVVWIASD